MSLTQWRTLKCVFQNSVRVRDVSSMMLKHLLKGAFVYSFLKLLITCWSMGCTRGVVLGGGEELDPDEILDNVLHQECQLFLLLLINIWS